MKISKDDAIHIILKCDTLETFLEEFFNYLKKIKNKIPLNDPNYIKIRDACDKGVACCIQHSRKKETKAKQCGVVNCVFDIGSKFMWVILISILICSMLSTIIFSLKSSIVEELRSHAMHGAWVGASQAILSMNSTSTDSNNSKHEKKKEKKKKKK